MKTWEFILKSGTKILLGKNAKNNDELVEKYQNKKNIILHTAKPGSPFCVIDLNASKRDIKESAIVCAFKSKDWRENKNNMIVHLFTGKNIYKEKNMKIGTWGLRKKPKIIRIKKEEIEKFEKGQKESN